jgi:hypothetical protein
VAGFSLSAQMGRDTIKWHHNCRNGLRIVEPGRAALGAGPRSKSGNAYSSRWSYSSVRQVYGQTVNGSGPGQYRYAPSLRGTYRFRASFAGKDGQTTATSRILSVSVH